MWPKGEHKRRRDNRLSKGKLREVGQNKGRLVNILVIVAEELLLLLRFECAKRLGEITIGILAADHEADLARGVSWDGRIGVLDIREDFFAVLLQLGDQWKVEPLVFGCR